MDVNFESGFEDGEIVPIEHVHEPHKALDDKLDAELQAIVDARVKQGIDEAVWEALLRFSIELTAHKKPLVTIRGFQFAAGLFILEGKSLTQLAEELSVKLADDFAADMKQGHPDHITKQALSNRIVNICKQLGLRPSRGMKSEDAREIYRAAQLRKGKRERII